MESPTHATCGPSSRRQFAEYDPDTCSWRTWPATGLWGSVEFSQTWPRCGTWDLGAAFEHRTSEHATCASGCSSWLATPTAWLGRRAVHSVGDPDRWTNPQRSNELSDQIAYLVAHDARASMTAPAARQHVADGNGSLAEALGAALLPTPTASDRHGTPSQERSQERSLERSLPLSEIVNLLPTPKASDGLMGTPSTSDRPREKSTHLATRVAMLPTPTAARYGSNQSPSPGAAVRPSLDALFSGESTSPGSDAGNAYSDE